MRLSEFIMANREPILAEWEAFARTLGPASKGMNIRALRDHANEMLTTIAKDLATPQDTQEQSDKSKGNAPALAHTTAAQRHGTERAESGFTVEQMMSEYRALRATVIRLWTKDQQQIGVTELEDLTRFNEAIDQAIAESIAKFSGDLDRSKETFLAILGHDLRSPLSTVITSAKFMLELGELAEPNLTLTSRIVSSATRMEHLIGDLLDFTRSRLGGGIPITRAPLNMNKVVHDVVDEIVAAHPGRSVNVDARGSQQGEWDGARVSQVVANLVGNALEHGSERGEVSVRVGGDEKEVTIAVHNRGDAIPPEQLASIFNPMKGGDGSGTTATQKSRGNLGLGLYIADRIVNAHQGTIDVASSPSDGTTFTVHMPRADSERPQGGTAAADAER